MANRTHLHSTLLKAVNDFDMDGVLYELVKIAYSKRDQESHEGANKAEHDHWHEVGGILAECQSKLEELNK